MNRQRRQLLALPALLALAPPAVSAAADETISVRGRIVCLTEILRDRYQVEPACDARGHVYAVSTPDKRLLPLLPTDSAAAVWLDQRYRERELNVIARPFPETSHIEVIRFQSWRNGKLYDLDYFCDVCMISTHKPGPCDCCQDPVVFRELPAQ